MSSSAVSVDLCSHSTKQKLRLPNGRTVIIRPLKLEKDVVDLIINLNHTKTSLKSVNSPRSIQSNHHVPFPQNKMRRRVTIATEDDDIQDTNRPFSKKLYLPDGRSIVLI